jgi:peptide subunit release factor 1 (eRF1)
MIIARRKFRSQTSDNMDRWKSKGGKSQKRQEKKREDQRRERARKVAMHCVFSNDLWLRRVDK